jgi:hypothetical protein
MEAESKSTTERIKGNLAMPMDFSAYLTFVIAAIQHFSA